MAPSTPADGRLAKGALTRQLLLEAGAQLLLEQARAGTDAWRRAISVRELSERAERSSGAFYKQFAGMDDYWPQLVEWVLDPAWFGVITDQHGTVIDGPWQQALREAAATADGFDRIAAAAAEDFRQLCTSSDRQAVASWISSQPEAGVEGTVLNAVLRRHYDTFDDATRQLYGQLLAEVAGRPPQPVAVAELATVVTTSVEGAWQRWRSLSVAQDQLADLCGRSVAAFAASVAPQG